MSFTTLLPSSKGTKEIIDPSSVSFDTILEDLYLDLGTRPQGQQWTSRFRGGVGTTLMEWLAAVTEDLKVSALLGARESSLQTARARTSIIRLATDLGYVVNRQTAARGRLPVNATIPIVLSPFIRLGTVDGTDIFPTVQQSLPAGNSLLDIVYATRADSDTKQVTVQESFNGLEWTASELGVTTIDQIDQDSAFFEVWIGGVRQEITYFPEKLGTDQADTTLLVKNLGDKIEIVSGFVGIPAGTDVFIRYLKVSGTDAILTDLAIDTAYNGILSVNPTGFVTVNNFINSDTNKKIATLAPGFHFSQRKAVTKGDYEVIANSLPGVKSAKWHEGQCLGGPTCQGGRRTKVACDAGDPSLVWVPTISDPLESPFGAPLAILLDTGLPMTQVDRDNILNAMDEFKFEGSHVVLVDAAPIVLTPELQIDIAVGADTTAIQLAAEVQAASLTGELGGEWIPAQLVQSLTCIEGVVHVYIGEDAGSGGNNHAKANRELISCSNEYYTIGSVTIDFRTIDSNFLSRYGA